MEKMKAKETSSKKNNNYNNYKTVWHVSNYESGDGKHSTWTRMGRGFVNRDQSITLYLDAIPTDWRFQVRDFVPREERGGQK